MTPQEAADLFRSDDLIGLGMEADKVRQKLHPEGVVTYVIQGELDLAYVDNRAAACDHLESLAAQGACSVLLAGSLPNPASIRACVDLVRALKKRLDIGISGFSPQQLSELAKGENLPLAGALVQLRDAGLDSICSGPMQATGDDTALWNEAHRAAHKAGMSTTARVAFKKGDTPAQRVAALDAIGRLQADRGGFVAVAPTFGVESTEEPTAVDYLKTLAASRLYLQGIPNCEDSWKGAGMKVCQVGLRFGANDLGIVEATGAGDRRPDVTPGELRRLIRDAGFLPKQRNEVYTACFLD